jgi:hypothetical protein
MQNIKVDQADKLVKRCACRLQSARSYFIEFQNQLMNITTFARKRESNNNCESSPTKPGRHCKHRIPLPRAHGRLNTRKDFVKMSGPILPLPQTLFEQTEEDDDTTRDTRTTGAESVSAVTSPRGRRPHEPPTMLRSVSVGGFVEQRRRVNSRLRDNHLTANLRSRTVSLSNQLTSTEREPILHDERSNRTIFVQGKFS